MPQQINLYSPILLTPRRYFSALAMLQALAVLGLGLAVLGGWVVHGTQQLRLGVAAAQQASAAEQQRLTGELLRKPAPPKDNTALEQQAAQARSQLAEREALLADLDAATAAPQLAHSVLLRHLAQTVPGAVWLTEVRLVQGRVELAGMTLQPEALRPWLARLAEHPALAGQALRTVRVERVEKAEGTAGSDVSSGPGAETWRFRVLSARPARVPGDTP